MIRNFIKNIMYLYYWFINYPTIATHNIIIGRNCHIRGRIFVQTVYGGSVSIGDNVNINSSLASNPIGGGLRQYSMPDWEVK